MQELRLDSPGPAARARRACRAIIPTNIGTRREEDTASKIEEAYRRFVLRDHVNFVMRAVENSGENGLVVDVGCGGGLLLRMLQERGLAVLGLEKSQAAASAAWKQNRVAVVRGDLAEGAHRAGKPAPW